MLKKEVLVQYFVCLEAYIYYISIEVINDKIFMLCMKVKTLRMSSSGCPMATRFQKLHEEKEEYSIQISRYVGGARISNHFTHIH